jgi:hypothetical protein
VRHFCLCAARTSPDVMENMSNYVELQLCAAPPLMSRAGERLISAGEQCTQRHLLREDVQMLDAALVMGIGRALRENGVNVEPQIRKLLRDEHSVGAAPRDLLSYFYCSSGVQPQEAMWAMPVHMVPRRLASVGYFRAYWVESRFSFVAEPGIDLALTLTLRVPNADENAHVLVFVNNHRVAALPAVRSWKTFELQVPSAHVREGFNAITVRWPLPHGTTNDGVERAARGLLINETDALYQIFGEIHRFVAGASGGAPR